MIIVSFIVINFPVSCMRVTHNRMTVDRPVNLAHNITPASTINSNSQDNRVDPLSSRVYLRISILE